MRIVGFAGSLRKDSLNRRLLAAVASRLEKVQEDVEFETIDLSDLPFFNEDLEAAGDPPAVVRLKDAVRNASGLLIATPEYNHAMPAVTKNTLDWLSRGPKPHALEGKPVAIMGATPGVFGTRRSQADLRQVLAVLGAYTMVRPWLLVSRGHEKLLDATAADERLSEAVERYTDAVAEWISRFV